MAAGTHGQFIPQYPEKYVGDVNDIEFRSKWEAYFMDFCDKNIMITQWGSEEIRIPYRKPTTGKIHQYIPDFFIKYTNSKGQVVKEIIEIKPSKEVALTKKSTLYDKVAIVINEAKWTAAKQFCEKHGMIFRILTEKSLFKTGKPPVKAKK